MPDKYKDSYTAFFGLFLLTAVAVVIQVTVGLSSSIGHFLSVVGIGGVFLLLSLKSVENFLFRIGRVLFRVEIKPWLLFTFYFIALLWWITLINTNYFL